MIRTRQVSCEASDPWVLRGEREPVLIVCGSIPVSDCYGTYLCEMHQRQAHH